MKFQYWLFNSILANILCETRSLPPPWQPFFWFFVGLTVRQLYAKHIRNLMEKLGFTVYYCTLLSNIVRVFQTVRHIFRFCPMGFFWNRFKLERNPMGRIRIDEYSPRQITITGYGRSYHGAKLYWSVSINGKY